MTKTLWTALPASIAAGPVLLRPLAEHDLPAMAGLADNGAIHAVLARLPHPYTIGHARQFLAQATDPDNSEKVYAIAEGGAFRGVVSMMLGTPLPEIGYWLGQPFWGRGLMTQAVSTLVLEAQATGRFPLLVARALETNLGSRRVLEKAGFKPVRRRLSELPHQAGQTLIEYELERER